jgi:hypothetical protein
VQWQGAPLCITPVNLLQNPADEFWHKVSRHKLSHLTGAAYFQAKTRHQFVTKTRLFPSLLLLGGTGKAKQAKGFSVYTSELTRWRSAVRARTGLPYFQSLPRLSLPAETLIVIRICHSGLKNRLLGLGNPMRMMHWHRKSQEDALVWSKTVPLGSIEATLGDLPREATKELFMLFGYWEPTDQIFGEVFNEFLKSYI